MLLSAFSQLAFLIAYAEPVGASEHMAEHHTLMIVSGSDASLAAFEVAARRCGVKGVSRVPDGQGGTWVRMRGPVSTAEVLSRYDCAKNWVTAHPADLRLIGD